MRYCDHTFVCIKELTEIKREAYVASKPIPSNLTPGGFIQVPEKIDLVSNFAVIACVYCGQIKHVYSDGSIVIVVKEGKIEK